ncbi:MAG: RusA family crossover junction endodeoxyribonuclease [Firmicutes bacterium]|jgi:hypothetical protein|nr:RusA family crossover junction endodeoxyribonuclease [Bacillota bacterium]
MANIILRYAIPVEGEPRGKERPRFVNNGQRLSVYTPDGDNILKAVADALNGVCYKDDKCLIKMSIEKFYSDVPRIEVVAQEAVIIDENDDSEMMRK